MELLTLSLISIHALREEGDLDFYYPAFANLGISIHALREEGDKRSAACVCVLENISIHALREEGDHLNFRCFCLFPISIHALREEGDLSSIAKILRMLLFLSTPSARRATSVGPPTMGRP